MELMITVVILARLIPSERKYFRYPDLICNEQAIGFKSEADTSRNLATVEAVGVRENHG